MTRNVVIIGGGVVGSAIAMHLSLRDVNVTLLEAGDDIGGSGATKANTAIVHGGYDPEPGTLMARLNVRGNEFYREMQMKLGIPFRQTGSLVVATEEEQVEKVKELYERGKKNGVPELRLLDAEETHKLEPNIRNPIMSLHCPTAGVVHPMRAAIAFAEAAYNNGARVFLNTSVTGVKVENGGVEGVYSDDDFFPADIVVNAAGLYADEIASMAGIEGMRIKPRRGQWAILPKDHPFLVSMPVFPAPTEMGKGITVSPTVDGDYLLGPTAEDNVTKEDTGCTREGIRNAIEGAEKLVKGIDRRRIIRHFAGLRAIGGDDFIIGATEVEGFYNAAGIKSPGLASAPAIGEYLADIISRKEGLEKVEGRDFSGKYVMPFRYLPEEMQAKLLKENPAYSRVVCRCEMVTEGDIRNAMKGPFGANSIDAVKRRTKATGGMCQGGRCTNAIAQIMADELGVPQEEITKNGRAPMYMGVLRK